MVVFLCALYCISLWWYLRRSLREGFAAQLVSKTATSVLFLLIACAAFIHTGGSERYFTLMLCALLFSLAGDVFIQLQRAHNAFRRYALALGAAAFFGAHCLFSAAFGLLAGFSWADIPVFAAAFLVLYAAFRLLRLDFGRLTPLCMLYLAAILFMLTKALSVGYLGGTAPLAGLLGAGAALFVASDTMLALKSFYPPCRNNAMLSLSVTLTYYLAQLLFALSILYA